MLSMQEASGQGGLKMPSKGIREVWFCYVTFDPFILEWEDAHPKCTSCGWVDKDSFWDFKDWYCSDGFLRMHTQRAIVGTIGMHIINIGGTLSFENDEDKQNLIRNEMSQK